MAAKQAERRESCLKTSVPFGINKNGSKMRGNQMLESWRVLPKGKKTRNLYTISLVDIREKLLDFDKLHEIIEAIEGVR